jgi:hypothetical protein
MKHEADVLLALVLTSIMLAAFYIIPSSFQQSGIDIGVSEGDWAKYAEVSVVWRSNDLNARPDPELVEANNTSWFNVTITKKVESDVETSVEFQSVIHFKNNTEAKKILSVNMDSGDGNGSLMLIPANLYTGQSVYPEYSGNPTYINETTWISYNNALREINHLNLTLNPASLNGESQLQVSIDYHWDVETGILTERFGSFENRTGGFVTFWSRSDKLVDTNLWGQHQQPLSNASNDNTWIWVLAVTVPTGLILAAALIWRRKTSSKDTRYRRRPKRR